MKRLVRTIAFTLFLNILAGCAPIVPPQRGDTTAVTPKTTQEDRRDDPQTLVRELLGKAPRSLPPFVLRDGAMLDGMYTEKPPAGSKCEWVRVNDYQWYPKRFFKRGRVSDKNFQPNDAAVIDCYPHNTTPYTTEYEALVAEYFANVFVVSDESVTEYNLPGLMDYTVLRAPKLLRYTNVLGERFRKRVWQKILRSHDLFYVDLMRWLMKSIRKLYAQIPDSLQRAYFELAKIADERIKRFDYRKERRYYRRLKRGKCEREMRLAQGKWICAAYHKDGDRDSLDAMRCKLSREARDELRKYGKQNCEQHFIVFGPDGKRDPMRRLQAFIFRRVHFDKMKRQLLEDTSSWLVYQLNDVLTRTQR